jgi:hypothetical protein
MSQISFTYSFKRNLVFTLKRMNNFRNPVRRGGPGLCMVGDMVKDVINKVVK